MSAGAMVVMVPCPTGETARGDVTLEHYAEWLDGVVMHGGADVWPGSYGEEPDRKSTRLNSSHLVISYAVFCLKKKKKYNARLLGEDFLNCFVHSFYHHMSFHHDKRLNY